EVAAAGDGLEDGLGEELVEGVGGVGGVVLGDLRFGDGVVGGDELGGGDVDDDEAVVAAVGGAGGGVGGGLEELVDGGVEGARAGHGFEGGIGGDLFLDEGFVGAGADGASHELHQPLFGSGVRAR